MKIHRKIHVSGKVQGVGFRDATQRKAIELGILGTVRNLDDGRVEIIASATSETLKSFNSWCQQSPPYAQVDNIDISELEAIGFSEFRIEY